MMKSIKTRRMICRSLQPIDDFVRVEGLHPIVITEDPDYVTLREVASRLRMDKRNLWKYATRKLGMVFSKRRTIHAGNQLELSLTKKDAALLIEKRIAGRYITLPRKEN
jgi:hypothetical protein